MSLLTMWGYTLTEADSLEQMLSAEEFDVLTGGKYRDEDRIEAESKAADAAIRNYCGWHLYPSMACEVNTTLLDARVTRVCNDLQIQLPAKYVSAIESVTIDGAEYAYTFEPSGLVRVYDACGAHNKRYSKVVVKYTAGLPESLMAPIKELIAHRVTHSVAVPSGITSEASGGVSVTYNANWINNSRATALAGDNKELLIPYRVQGVF
jgi:hypothetical protein